MIFSIGAVLFLAGWFAIKVVYIPYHHSNTPLEWTIAISMILGIILILTSLGMLAWDYLP